MRRIGRRVSIGLITCAAMFASLMLSPRWVTRPLLDAYAAGGTALFGHIGDNGRASLRTIEIEDSRYDAMLRLVNRSKGTQGEWRVNARSLWFRPAAFLVALALATPLPWVRRIGWTAAGLVMVTGYAYLRLLLLIVLRFSEPSPVRLFEPSHPTMRLLEQAYAFLVDSQSGWTVVVLPIWALTAFREALRPSGVQSDSRSGTPAMRRAGATRQ